MKKFIALCALGTMLAVTGCASKQNDVSYNEESAAPYSESRTAGETTVTTTRSDRTFDRRQRK